MPLVRISLPCGQTQDHARAVSRGVHQAMVETFNVPADDFFQIVTEHIAGVGLLGPPSFLGVEHTPEMVFVQITCAEGRSTDQKKALYGRIVEHIHRNAGFRREDVIINLVETKRENWSFGNGVASFV
jgi:phenylpyruvate tautomerase PptA (4-oxalocrotonate tautomerase family)